MLAVVLGFVALAVITLAPAVVVCVAMVVVVVVKAIVMAIAKATAEITILPHVVPVMVVRQTVGAVVTQTAGESIQLVPVMALTLNKE